MSLTTLTFSLFHSCVVGACLWILIPLHSFGVLLHILGYFHAYSRGGRMSLAISLSLVIWLVFFVDMRVSDFCQSTRWHDIVSDNTLVDIGLSFCGSVNMLAPHNFSLTFNNFHINAAYVFFSGG